MKRLFAVISTCFLVFCTPVYASGSPSLDDVISESEAGQAQQEAPANTSDNLPGFGLSADDLKDLTGFKTDNEVVGKFNEGRNKVMGVIVPVMSGIIISLLTVTKLIDFIFIVASFARDFLGGSYYAQAQNGGSQGAQDGGYGGNQHYDGVGGYSGRGNRGSRRQEQRMAKRQWASNEAVSAVLESLETGESALKSWGKHMIVQLIAIPVLLGLTVSGLLTNIGIYLFDWINVAISERMGI